MPSGISIHIGLNRVDPNHYHDEGGRPWDGTLAGCENDARDMRALAKKRQFGQALMLLNEQASAQGILAALAQAAKALKSGDTLLLTYSGHGGQVPDRNDDESDGLDETWCAFDRQIVDDELYAAWAKFAKGVRILMLSDSCHSGSVSKAPLIGPVMAAIPGGRARLAPESVQAGTYKSHKKLYDAIQKATPGEAVPIKASVVLISGCQDNQLSSDGDGNGLFTATLKKVWRGGRFRGNLRKFHKAIVQQMPLWQSPNYFVVGAPNAGFEGGKPFEI